MSSLANRVSFIPLDMVVVVFPLAAVILGDSLIYIVLPASFADFGVGNALGLSAAFWIGLALSINRFIRLASNSLAAQIYQRLGFRGPFIAATVLGVLTTLSYGFIRGVLLLLLARALWGIAYSHLRLGAYITAFEVGDPRHSGRLLGFYNSGQRAGSFVAVTAGAVLADSATRGVTFTVLAAVGILGVLVALRAPRLRMAHLRVGRADGQSRGERRHGRIWDVAISGAAEAPVGVRWRMLAISVLRFSTAFAANGLAIATISPYLAELFSEDSTVFGLTVSIITLAGILVGFRWFANLTLGIPLGQLSDRVGRRRSVIGGAVVMLGALTLVWLAPSAEAVVLAVPLLFISGAAMEAALDAAMGETSPRAVRASAMARYATWLDLGAAPGPIVGFVIGDALGFSAGYGIAVGIVLAAAAGYVVATRGRADGAAEAAAA